MKQNLYNKEIFNKIADKIAKLKKTKIKQIKNNDIDYLRTEGAANILRWVLNMMQGGK